MLGTVATKAEEFYRNPVICGDHPDPSIIRAGNDFWATCTSSEWGPEFPLLHSTDLVNWELTGSVFAHRPHWAVANFWAPEISEYKGHYAVYYVGRKRAGPLSLWPRQISQADLTWITVRWWRRMMVQSIHPRSRMKMACVI